MPAQGRRRKHFPSPRILVDIIDSFRIRVQSREGRTSRSAARGTSEYHKRAPRCQYGMRLVMGTLHGHERCPVMEIKCVRGLHAPAVSRWKKRFTWAASMYRFAQYFRETKTGQTPDWKLQMFYGASLRGHRDGEPKVSRKRLLSINRESQPQRFFFFFLFFFLCRLNGIVSPSAANFQHRRISREFEPLFQGYLK